MTLVRLVRRGSSSRGGEPPRRDAQVIPFPNADWRSLRRYWLVLAGLVALLGVAYVALDAAHLPLLEEPERTAVGAGRFSSAVVFGLLAGDVVLPVPVGTVVAAAGTLYGPLIGAAIAMAGGLASTAIAFWVGRQASPLLVRLVGPVERVTADRLVDRYGDVALLLTRPVPLLAEATALLAGASPLPWPRALLGAAVGLLPGAMLYSAAGWLAAGPVGIGTLLAATVVLGGIYVLGDRVRRAEEDVE